jgi:hypothetical protein
MLINKKIVIANVYEGRHYVLLTGFNKDSNTFIVNDPFYYPLGEVSTYMYSEIVGYIIY